MQCQLPADLILNYHTMASSAALVVVAVIASCFATDTYITTSLTTHNAYRKVHHAPALKLSQDLNKRALQCAQYYSKLGKMDHSCPYKNGAADNIAYIKSNKKAPTQDRAAARAIAKWYAEVTNYNYGNPASSTGTVGHFTQMVWADSTQFGIGAYPNTTSRTTYTVALYSPSGNKFYGNKGGDKYEIYKQNVLAP